MEILVPIVVFLGIALIALLSPLFGVDSRVDEPTWPDAPVSGRDARRLLRW